MYYDKAQEWFDDEADKYFAKHEGALERILMERLEAKSLEKGLIEGKKEGLEEGRLESLIDLVKKNYLPIDVAIKESGLSEEEFKEKLKNS